MERTTKRSTALGHNAALDFAEQTTYDGTRRFPAEHKWIEVYIRHRLLNNIRNLAASNGIILLRMNTAIFHLVAFDVKILLESCE